MSEKCKPFYGFKNFREYPNEIEKPPLNENTIKENPKEQLDFLDKLLINYTEKVKNYGVS